MVEDDGIRAIDGAVGDVVGFLSNESVDDEFSKFIELTPANQSMEIDGDAKGVRRVTDSRRSSCVSFEIKCKHVDKRRVMIVLIERKFEIHSCASNLC